MPRMFFTAASSEASDSGTGEADGSGGKKTARSFNSALLLQVWVLDTRFTWNVVGTTPARTALTISECVIWGVEPLGYWDHNWAALARVTYQERIPGLKMHGDTQDADLAHFKDCRALQVLYLPRAQVTDVGLAHLTQLKSLQRLDLRLTQVTGAGLVHLHELHGLRTLHLGATHVTDAELVHLKNLRGLQILMLEGAKVTDAGLAHLMDLRGLKWLDLWGTKVTDAGKNELRRALPNCTIK